MGRKWYPRGPVARDKEPYRVNENIKAKEVKVVDENNKFLGVMPLKEALELAYDRGYDLVEIVPTDNPPLCKILDYGKFKYEMKKKKKHTKTAEEKEISFRPSTSEHDLELKIKKLNEFIKGGHKVRVRLFFRGREVIFIDTQGREIMEKFIDKVKEFAEPEGEIKKAGDKQLFVIMKPKKKK
ncbi:MAG: translation initiation factor IF-3 [Candidatus Hydrothermales bacterium]